jgi:hypothetical protein
MDKEVRQAFLPAEFFLHLRQPNILLSVKGSLLHGPATTVWLLPIGRIAVNTILFTCRVFQPTPLRQNKDSLVSWFSPHPPLEGILADRKELIYEHLVQAFIRHMQTEEHPFVLSQSGNKQNPACNRTIRTKLQDSVAKRLIFTQIFDDILIPDKEIMHGLTILKFLVGIP